MLRIRPINEIKHYLYISDSKLEMLYRQISPTKKEKTAFEWAINLHAVKVSRKKDAEYETDYDDKLKAVIRELEKAKLVGTVDSPNQYFKGNLLIRWGTLRDWGRPLGESPLIYFGGKTRKSIFGLGGSSKHVIGNAGSSSTDSRSSAPSIIGEILTGLGISSEGWNSSRKLPGEDEYDTYEAINWANKNLKWAPVQNIEFYAKTLLVGDYHNDKGHAIKAVLGSPIYAALVPPCRDFSYCK